MTLEIPASITVSPGKALTFSGARLDLAALGDGQMVTVQFTGTPPGAIHLPASQAVLATADSTVCSASPPAFAATGVTNAASLEQGISPGSVATLSGTNLIGAPSGTLLANNLPLPLELGGTSLTVNGFAAPLFAIAKTKEEEQIHFQAPWELGDSGSSAQPTLVVTRHGVSSAPVKVDLLPVQPGIFTTDGSTGAILHADSFLPVTASNPASPGEVVTIYATGLGPVTATPPTGAAALADPFSETLHVVTATVGGAQATVRSSGLAPGLVGVYRVDIEVPGVLSLDQPTVDFDVVITANGITSNAVKIAVQSLGGLANP